MMICINRCEEGSVDFMNYYPVGRSSLGDLRGSRLGYCGDGVSILLPEDFNRLSQIKVKVLMAN